MHFPELRVRPWVFLVLLFVLSLPAVTVRLYASDEIEYFAYLRSMWFDRDLSFDNEYRYFHDRGVARAWRFKEAFLDGETPTGLRTNFAPVGSAVLWTPMYAAADAGVRIARASGSTVPADGFSRPYIAAIAYGSAIYGFAALLLSAYAASRIAGTGGTALQPSLVAVIAVWLGTPLLFYMYVAPGFSHACSAFAVAAFVVAWLHVRRDWSWPGVAALGALAALMGMVREQDVFIAVGPALDYVVTFARNAREGERSVRAIVARAGVGIATFAVCFLPQLMAYRILNGRFGPSATVEQKMTWTSPNAWRVLVSPENGLFFWTPLALPAFVGLVFLAIANRRAGPVSANVEPRDRAWIGVVCVVMVLTQIYLAGSLDTWAGAGSFGQRRLVGLTVFLVVGLAALLHTFADRWQRRLLYGGVALSMWWNLGVTAQFGSGLMDRQHMDIGRVAYHNFVTVPKLVPSLAYRYAFERESFYRPSSSPIP
jgi:hypothetical protein